MSLSGRERRILAEIERGLEREDPALARRVAEINRIEARGEAVPAAPSPPGASDRLREWAFAHPWVIFWAGALMIIALLVAVLSS